MAYNPYAAVNAIYNLKGQWTEADKSGDAKKKKEAEKTAKEYYKELQKNGYGNVADSLSSASYADSKRINDAWSKFGKTNGTDYIKSLGKSYGMSDNDINNLMSYDGITGQMTLGGTAIGTPDAMVDGVSYWNDTSKIDSAFNDYITRSGTAKSNSALISQENQKLFDRLAGEYEDLKNENPFETEVGKSILDKYSLAGFNGRENELASAGASNGGNIDSFAAANALRQQASLVTQGRDAALAAHQQRIDNARALLSDMGVHIDRVYNQDETSKNNQVARDVSVSEVTGVVPESMAYASNPYFNADGTLADAYNTAEFDANGGFQRIINDANEKLKTTTNSAERANLEATVKYATQARAYKIKNSPAHGKYAHTLTVTAPEETASYKLGNKEIDSQVKMNSDNIASNEKLTEAQINAEKQMNAANNASNERVASMKNDEGGDSYTSAELEKIRTSKNGKEVKSILTEQGNDAAYQWLADKVGEDPNFSAEEANAIALAWGIEVPY